MKPLRLGLLINPLAGIGGAVGLKGSDGAEIVAQALALGAEKRAPLRVSQVLEKLLPYKEQIFFLAAPAEMGERLCQQFGFAYTVVGRPAPGAGMTTAADTQAAVQAMLAEGIDVLLFAGGDGTARDLVNWVPATQLCLGIPAGVKIHSGVYAINAHGAVEILQQLLSGAGLAVALAEVRDIDEAAFRQGEVRARYYGELLTPVEDRYLQQVKCSGVQAEPIQLQELAAYMVEHMEPECLYVIGPGSTTQAIMGELGLASTLLGVDVVKAGELVALDASEQQLLALTAEQSARIIVTLIGGQGHVLGRGNHQLSPALIRQVGVNNLQIISPPGKLAALQGRPLLVDTYDEALNQQLAGLVTVITGYEQQVACQLAY